jgi:hypothetical protein
MSNRFQVRCPAFEGTDASADVHAVYVVCADSAEEAAEKWADWYDTFSNAGEWHADLFCDGVDVFVCYESDPEEVRCVNVRSRPREYEGQLMMVPMK